MHRFQQIPCKYVHNKDYKGREQERRDVSNISSKQENLIDCTVGNVYKLSGAAARTKFLSENMVVKMQNTVKMGCINN